MDIRVIEKPEFISWDAIHNILWKAHENNREKGIIMKFPSLPGEEIQKRIEGKGKIFIALINGELVGCVAFIIKDKKTWYNNGKYFYFCFEGILPNFRGLGIYKMLCEVREKACQEHSINTYVFDTNEKNKRVIEINEKNGFRKVGVKNRGDRYSVTLARWKGDCPYSKIYCMYKYCKSYLKCKYLHC